MKIELKSQDKDRELLLKQIIAQKKINQREKAKLEKTKKVAEVLEKKMKEEQKMEELRPKTGKAKRGFSVSKKKRAATAKGGAGMRSSFAG